MSEGTESKISTEKRDHVLLIGFNRAKKMNAFDTGMLKELSAAYGRLEEDDDLRCGVLFAHGDNFTAGLDLADVGPAMARGQALIEPGAVDPWGVQGRARTKPMVVAVHGRCLTLGIELCLASDIRVAARNTRFAQIEVKRGIFPFGGATVRLPQVAGWGNAMRWLLTGDEFDAAEAYRIGLVQEVVEDGAQLDRAVALAQKVAAQAPLAVRATIASARASVNEEGALRQLVPETLRLMKTADAQEGMMSFIERRDAKFQGK